MVNGSILASSPISVLLESLLNSEYVGTFLLKVAHSLIRNVGGLPLFDSIMLLLISMNLVFSEGQVAHTLIRSLVVINFVFKIFGFDVHIVFQFEWGLNLSSGRPLNLELGWILCSGYSLLWAKLDFLTWNWKIHGRHLKEGLLGFVDLIEQ